MFGMLSKCSVILELQEAATDRTNDISDLLRKCLLVATKLKLTEFKSWVNSELNGYERGDVPTYRELHAVMKVLNPFHGLQPFFLPPEIEEKLCYVEFRGPISKIVGVLENQRRGSGKLPPSFPIPADLRNYLLNHMDVPIEPMRIVNETQLESLIDGVRSRILEWALNLEEQGILGEGMTFTKEEKQRAKAGQSIHIGNFQGNIGNITESTVTQNLSMSVGERDFEALRSVLSEKGVSEQDLVELEHALAKDPSPKNAKKFGPAVSSWIGKMISKSASGAWEIGAGAAGELLATVIAAYYGIGS